MNLDLRLINASCDMYIVYTTEFLFSLFLLLSHSRIMQICHGEGDHEPLAEECTIVGRCHSLGRFCMSYREGSLLGRKSPNSDWQVPDDLMGYIIRRRRSLLRQFQCGKSFLRGYLLWIPISCELFAIHKKMANFRCMYIWWNSYWFKKTGI